jgi:predicted N-acetyltransferase YhbS
MRRACIADVAVRPEHQGRGLGFLRMTPRAGGLAFHTAGSHL